MIARLAAACVAALCPLWAWAQAPLPAPCAVPASLPPVKDLPQPALFRTESLLRNGYTRSTTIRVVRGVADRRLQRSVIAEIDMALRRLQCPGVAAVRFEVYVTTEGGAFQLSAWEPEPAPPPASQASDAAPN